MTNLKGDPINVNDCIIHIHDIYQSYKKILEKKKTNDKISFVLEEIEKVGKYTINSYWEFFIKLHVESESLIYVRKIYTPYSPSGVFGYYNMETGICKSLENIKCTEDFVNHQHDFEGDYTKDLRRREKRVIAIKKIPQYEQKSEEWLKQRGTCLTATAIAECLDEDKYHHPIEVFLDKCGVGKPFKGNTFTYHGNKYEEIINMLYCFRQNVKTSEYGMIKHAVHDYIGASPDGICDANINKNLKSNLVGRLLEIKAPGPRQIEMEGDLDGVQCPHQYYVQVQTQLFVTELDECDFNQCKIREYRDWDEYLEDEHDTLSGVSKTTNMEKGCVIQLLPKKTLGGKPEECLYMSKFLYPPRLHMSPSEIKDWIAEAKSEFPKHKYYKDYVIDKVFYWKIDMAFVVLIKKDLEWYESKLPAIKQFWDYVRFFKDPKRKNDLTKIKAFAEEIGVKNSAEIFEKVHKIYARHNPKTTYKPLYKTPTKWRLKYDALEKEKKQAQKDRMAKYSSLED